MGLNFRTIKTRCEGYKERELIMDTSKEYIKMCDCPEIQDLWQPKEGDHKDLVWSNWDSMTMKHKGKGKVWVANLNTWAEVRKSDAGEGWFKKFCIWLPRQDQLQEMIGNLSIAEILDLTCDMFDDVKVMQEGYGLTFESLLLQVVMKEKFNKIWHSQLWKHN